LARYIEALSGRGQTAELAPTSGNPLWMPNQKTDINNQRPNLD
jgi:hypothetical protein